MKLKTLIVSNFQILSDISLDLGRCPITLIAGANEQGKTSIPDALAFAFSGRASRIPLKKDYDQLVRDGAKKGQISIEWEGGKARVNLPSGGHLSEGTIPPAIEYVLRANRFAELSDDARRTFLFALLNAKIGPAELDRRLRAKGHAAEKIVACRVSSGAAAAHKEAKAKAAESRGAWKATTNEAYGNTKGATWEPPAVDFNPEELEAARTALTEESANVIRLVQANAEFNQAATAAAQQARHVEALREKAGQHARVAAKLVTDEAELVAIAHKLEESRAAARQLGGKKAPDDLAALIDIAQEVLDLVGKTQLVSSLTGEIVPWDDGLVTCIQTAVDKHKAVYGAGSEPDQATKELAAKEGERLAAYTLMKNAVANDQRDLALVELAVKELANLPEKPAPLPEDPMDELSAARARVAPLQQNVNRMEALERAAAGRLTAIETARRHHADVQAWEAIADDLAPDGIPGEMLKDALRPFNDRLRATSIATGWPQVAIDADMQITIGGRAYALGSESARWRADAAIAEAVAVLSGVKVLVIDRMDVLDLPNRATFMGWIDAISNAGDIDTALICATLKDLPKGFPDNWSLHWLENGVIYDQAQQDAAA